jgi:ParB family chromosome partitioning protein
MNRSQPSRLSESSQPPPLAEVKQERVLLPLDAILPDPRNRKIVEDEDFQGLLDSIRVLGVLSPPHVVDQGSGRYLLIDGERRWRAARRAGLSEIPCDVWPVGAEPRALSLAGLVLNEQRKAPGCIHVARRLRDMKHELALTHEALAAQTGLPLDRVKSYLTV